MPGFDGVQEPEEILSLKYKKIIQDVRHIKILGPDLEKSLPKCLLVLVRKAEFRADYRTGSLGYALWHCRYSMVISRAGYNNSGFGEFCECVFYAQLWEGMC